MTPADKKKKEEDPYFVEVDSNGCRHCGVGRTWTVIGPNGVGASRSWEDEEDAENFADSLNEAFWRGRTEPSQR